MLSKLESWDYICVFMICLGLWLVLGGARKLHEANPEKVAEKPLLIRGWGAIAISAAYLFCHFMAEQ